MLRGKKILVGITGSIAAYKAAILVRNLIRGGAEVKVVMTRLAKQFITPLTMATLSKNPILVDFFDPEDGRWNSHVSLGEWADAYLIAPATANTMAKMATGVADNLLLTAYLSARCPVFVAPAMDLDMFAHRATQRNLETLRADGVIIVQPGEGELASGLTGKGRMAEPDEIYARLSDFFAGAAAGNAGGYASGTDCGGGSPADYRGVSGKYSGDGSGEVPGGTSGYGSGYDAVSTVGCGARSGNAGDSGAHSGPASEVVSDTETGADRPDVADTAGPAECGCEKKKSLRGIKVLVTAGPTVEPIDPVRYISNHSTGKMGYAIAGELARRGAEVVLVSGPVALEAPGGVELVRVGTAREMYDAAVGAFEAAAGCRAAVLCAAVADYTPSEYSATKIKKSPAQDCMELRLEKTRDIAAALGAVKGGRVIAGFALETDNEAENARRKLAAKNMDFIVLNSLRDPGAGFGHDTNVISIISADGSVDRHPLMSKESAAGVIVDELAARLGY
ncbi:MAG: bifunctional phosphopantothenoylcysteine decarboxylase/phosphopantothenate synthase [Alistipes sp.]|nr:bifunctional phosphopantothenoylcysteine decarboxylase/phosphopantothenate synthase [Alistipes sp.]